MRNVMKVVLLLVVMLSGCAPRRPLEPESTSVPSEIPPEKAPELLGEMGENWLYGQGVGETALTVGGILLFPPFGLVVLGNEAIALTGHERLSITDAMPEEIGAMYGEAYDGVTSTPGRMAAAVAEREFVTKQEAQKRIERVLKESSTKEPR